MVHPKRRGPNRRLGGYGATRWDSEGTGADHAEGGHGYFEHFMIMSMRYAPTQRRITGQA